MGGCHYCAISKGIDHRVVALTHALMNRILDKNLGHHWDSKWNIQDSK